MKIAVVIHHFDEKRGGAERFAVELARYAVEEGHEVDVYAASLGEKVEGVKSHRVRGVGWPRFLYELRFAVRSSGETRKGKHDIVLGINRTFHQDIYAPPGGVHRSWFDQDLRSIRNPYGRRARLVWRLLSPKQWSIFYIEKRIYRGQEKRDRRQETGNRGEGVRRIVANSGMVREEMARREKVIPEMVKVVYHGVDLERLHPRNREELREETRGSLGVKQERIILFVGHNARLKGLGPFIRVMGVLKKRGLTGFKGVVVGRGKPGPFLREAKRLGCSDVMVFAGLQKEITGVYAAGDLLLQPTFFDPCSLTTLEALACGLPVVTTRFNGAGELITDGEEGYVVDDPWDVEKLADRVAELLDGERLTVCSVKARQLAERFPQRRNYSRILELCVEVAGEKREKDG